MVNIIKDYTALRTLTIDAINFYLRAFPEAVLGKNRAQKACQCLENNNQPSVTLSILLAIFCPPGVFFTLFSKSSTRLAKIISGYLINGEYFCGAVQQNDLSSTVFSTHYLNSLKRQNDLHNAVSGEYFSWSSLNKVKSIEVLLKMAQQQDFSLAECLEITKSVQKMAQIFRDNNDKQIAQTDLPSLELHDVSSTSELTMRWHTTN